MKIKNALAGLFGLLGSFTAFSFLAVFFPARCVPGPFLFKLKQSSRGVKPEELKNKKEDRRKAEEDSDIYAIARNKKRRNRNRDQPPSPAFDLV